MSLSFPRAQRLIDASKTRRRTALSVSSVRTLWLVGSSRAIRYPLSCPASVAARRAAAISPADIPSSADASSTNTAESLESSRIFCENVVVSRASRDEISRISCC
ncbi:Uncharacterised protein [Mycobacteroides abscessus subsp. abscessus]|nr:Uncharacterised protein [Mycobacteroides abscessus subsp. abscessus]